MGSVIYKRTEVRAKGWELHSRACVLPAQGGGCPDGVGTGSYPEAAEPEAAGGRGGCCNPLGAGGLRLVSAAGPGSCRGGSRFATARLRAPDAGRLLRAGGVGAGGVSAPRAPSGLSRGTHQLRRRQPRGPSGRRRGQAGRRAGAKAAVDPAIPQPATGAHLCRDKGAALSEPPLEVNVLGWPSAFSSSLMHRHDHPGFRIHQKEVSEHHSHGLFPEWKGRWCFDSGPTSANISQIGKAAAHSPVKAGLGATQAQSYRIPFSYLCNKSHSGNKDGLLKNKHISEKSVSSSVFTK
nr:uncharacterized protein LOC131279260 [Dasypus novemcinctus]